MPGFEVTGSHDLAILARRLKDAGERDLRNQLLRNVRKPAQEAIPDVRASARERLPKRGGLNELVANKDYKVRSRYYAGGVVVRIVGTGLRTLKLINSGGVRHPVFGEWRAGVATQSVEPGYFDDPLRARRPNFLRAVEQTVRDVTRQITRRY